MNHVGLGANVAEENTSFNTHVDSTGQLLAGRNGPYTLEFAERPPQTAFWSATLYRAETGRLHANSAHRHALGSAALGDEGSARLVISHADPGTANWLPCPEGEFYLILRIYSPGQEVVAGPGCPLRCVEERARRTTYDRTGRGSGSSAAGSPVMSSREVSCIVATTTRPTSAANTA